MNKVIFISAILLFSMNYKLFSQDPATAYEYGEISKVINNFYSYLTFEEKETPKLDKLKYIFHDKGLLINNNQDSPKTYTLHEFTEIIHSQVRTGKVLAFKEDELNSKIELFGKIAQCFSTYEASYLLAGREDYITKRGINSIQLIKVNGYWKIASVTWNEENEELKLPKKYLSE